MFPLPILHIHSQTNCCPYDMCCFFHEKRYNCCCEDYKAADIAISFGIVKDNKNKKSCYVILRFLTFLWHTSTSLFSHIKQVVPNCGRIDAFMFCLKWMWFLYHYILLSTDLPLLVKDDTSFHFKSIWKYWPVNGNLHVI